MRNLTALFHQRIGIPENEMITFEKVSEILEKTAKEIPFENLSIINNTNKDITKENLVDKMFKEKGGGLCYELNPLFYYYLLENGFKATMASGVVYNPSTGEYTKLGRTHVTIIIEHENQTYLIDTGFGANLPLTPVPFSGETVSTNNGEFRIKEANHEYEDYCLEMKLKHKDSDWRIGYAFDSKNPINTDELNQIQTIIKEHPGSSFNKHPLITRLTDNGSVSLTSHTFTQWQDGIVSKETVDEESFKELAKQHFGM